MFSSWSALDGIYTIPNVSTNYENIGHNKSLLDISVIKQLQEITQFKLLRFECYKPSHNRKVDIATLDNAKGHGVVNFYLFQNTTAPLACGTYKTLPNDNSKLGAACSSWAGKTWASKGRKATSIQLYELEFFINSQSYFRVANKKYGHRWRCDDFYKHKHTR